MLEQLDLFADSRFHIKDYPMVHLIELFAGIGSQHEAMKRLGVPFRATPIEYDKYSIAGYNAIHGTDFPTMDITQIHADDLDINPKECTICFYSFPCQDISGAGKGKGFSKEEWESGNSTRSGLLWEVERLLNELKQKGDGLATYLPQVLICENVPLIISKKNMPDFNMWLDALNKLGYTNYYDILNAADYGIPQNRKRFFMVSLLGNYSYRFPRKIPLKYVMKHFLEKEVDEKYYLSDAMVEFFVANNEKQKEKGNGFRFDPASRERERVKTITTNAGNRMDDNFIKD